MLTIKSVWSILIFGRQIKKKRFKCFRKYKFLYSSNKTWHHLKKMSIHKIIQTNFISFGGWKITHLEKTKYNKKMTKSMKYYFTYEIVVTYHLG